MLICFAGLGLVALAHLILLGALVAIARRHKSSRALQLLFVGEVLEIIAPVLAALKGLPGPEFGPSVLVWVVGVIVLLGSLVCLLLQAQRESASGASIGSVLLGTLLHASGWPLAFFGFISTLHFSGISM